MKAVNFFYSLMQFFVQWFLIAVVLAFFLMLLWPPVVFGLFYGMVFNKLMSPSIDYTQAAQISFYLSLIVMLCRTKFIAW